MAAGGVSADAAVKVSVLSALLFQRSVLSLVQRDQRQIVIQMEMQGPRVHVCESDVKEGGGKAIKGFQPKGFKTRSARLSTAIETITGGSICFPVSVFKKLLFVIDGTSRHAQQLIFDFLTPNCIMSNLFASVT